MVELVRDKKIIHLGATDHIGLIDEKIKKNIWLHKLLTESSSKCLGIDINDEAVSYCNKIGWNNIHCCNMLNEYEKVSELVDDVYFDYLVAGEIIEHIDNPVDFLSQINNKYKNKIQKIIITVPNAFRIANFKFALRGIEGINTDHKYWFTPYTICKVVSEAGMIPEEVMYAGKASGKTGLLMKLFKKNICADDIILVASLK